MPMIAGLRATLGVSPEGIGITIGVDRLLDMARTTVNVGSDIVTATIVDDGLKRAEAKAVARADCRRSRTQFASIRCRAASKAGPSRCSLTRPTVGGW